MVRDALSVVAGVGVNVAVYVLAFAFGLQFTYLLLVTVIGRQAEWMQHAGATLAYVVAGAITAKWSRHILATVLPALLLAFWSFGAWKWAIHMADTRGAWAPSIWSYVLTPSTGEVVTCLVATAGAACGWALVRCRVRAKKRL